MTKHAALRPSVESLLEGKVCAWLNRREGEIYRSTA